MKWDITKLKEYTNSRGFALLFSISFTELMKTVIKFKS